MRVASLVGLSSLLSITAGCSTHPLPEDFSRRTTLEIVKHIRCEVADGIHQLGEVSKEELEGTVLGFDFTFTITEENEATSAKIGLTNPVGGGTFKLDLAGGAEKQRINERMFRVIDTMSALRDRTDCSDTAERPNFVYPITGRIGMAELVQTYWGVRELSTPTLGENKRFFSDKLTFTTTLSAGITPKLEVSAGNADFKLTNASIDGSVLRKDIHQVTVAIMESVAKRTIEVPVKITVPAPRTERDGGEERARTRTVIRKRTITVPNTSSATEAVIDELNRQRDRDDLRDYGVPLRVAP